MYILAFRNYHKTHMYVCIYVRMKGPPTHNTKKIEINYLFTPKETWKDGDTYVKRSETDQLTNCGDVGVVILFITVSVDDTGLANVGISQN